MKNQYFSLFKSQTLSSLNYKIKIIHCYMLVFSPSQPPDFIFMYHKLSKISGQIFNIFYLPCEYINEFTR